MRALDLSEKLSPGMPFYPSDPKVDFEKVKNIESHSSQVHRIKLGTHSGTHVDAASHIIPDGKSIDEYTLDYFFGRCLVVSLDTWKEKMALFDSLNGIVVHTGWPEKCASKEDYFLGIRPEIPLELVNLCIKKGLKFIGCDMPSVDKKGSKEKPIHHKILSNDMVIYETLVNLDSIPIDTVFDFIGLPLYLEKLDASPIRAIALIQ